MLTVPQVAELLGIDPSTVVRRIKRGDIPAIDISIRGGRRRQYRVEPADLERYKKLSKVISNTTAPRRKRKREKLTMFAHLDK